MIKRTSIRDDYRRARSDSEKADRRARILDAAELMIAQGGDGAFTMATLAKNAGASKGTLYLYFESKTAVLEALFVKHWEAWASGLRDRIEPGMADSAFCELFLAQTRNDTFLFPRSTWLAPIESDPEAFAEVVGVVQELIRPLAEHIEQCLELAPGAGVRVVMALWALLVGAMRTGPKLTSSVDPPQLRASLDRLGILSCEDLFLQHGPIILAGLRGE